MLAAALTEDDGAIKPILWDLPASADETGCGLGCFVDHENPARERFYSRHLSASVPLCPAAAFGRSQSLKRRRARSVGHERLRTMVEDRLHLCRSSEVRRGDILYFLGQCLPVIHASRNPTSVYGWPASRIVTVAREVVLPTHSMVRVVRWIDHPGFCLGCRENLSL